MIKSIPSINADIDVLSNKQNRMVFRDILKHNVQTPDEIGNVLNLPNSLVHTSIKTLVAANLIKSVSSIPTASGAMTFYSASIDGLKVKRAIESGFRLGLD